MVLIMTYFVGLLIFIGVYVVAKFLLGKVESLSGVAETLAVIIGILCSLLYVGAL